MYLQPCIVLHICIRNTVVQQQFSLILAVYCIYLGMHGCVIWSFFIHMVFLKPYYSLCILSHNLLQKIYDELLMIGFHTSLEGDFSAIHQGLSDQNNNLIINTSKKLHSHTKQALCKHRVQSRSHIQYDDVLAQQHLWQPKKKEKEGTIYQDCLLLSFFKFCPCSTYPQLGLYEQEISLESL